ncbi:MAG: gamma carbonic anhydrase family protein [Eubacteriales bacterium]|nr:gamma carbonic anhydrase family protein [Eubacteriales bacterium]
MADYKQVKISEKAHVSTHAALVGDVTVEDYATVFFFATIRGDDDRVVIGKHSNVQESCTIHCSEGNPTILGENVTVGHNAVLHGCQVGDNTIIGMGSIILDGTKIGKNCMIAAGSLITKNKEIPDGSMVMGSPAKVKRALTEEEIADLQWSAQMCERDGKEMTEQGVF